MENDITEKHIKDAVNYVMKQNPPQETERQIKFTRHCKTKGTVTYKSGDLFFEGCSDTECVNCQQIHKTFQEEVEYHLKNLKNE
jgi:hypothetical protein